jgi:multiple sugar transport system ATP-binding protein
VFRRGAVRLELPPEAATRLSSQDGREVVIGIRAEDVAEHGTHVAGRSLGGRILSVLPVGSDQFLELDVAGSKLFFRVGKEYQPRAGEQVELGINLNRLHVFDKQTTQNLLWN